MFTPFRALSEHAQKISRRVRFRKSIMGQYYYMNSNNISTKAKRAGIIRKRTFNDMARLLGILLLLLDHRLLPDTVFCEY